MRRLTHLTRRSLQTTKTTRRRRRRSSRLPPRGRAARARPAAAAERAPPAPLQRRRQVPAARAPQPAKRRLRSGRRPTLGCSRPPASGGQVQRCAVTLERAVIPTARCILLAVCTPAAMCRTFRHTRHCAMPAVLVNYHTLLLKFKGMFHSLQARRRPGGRRRRRSVPRLRWCQSALRRRRRRSSWRRRERSPTRRWAFRC